MPQPEHSYNNSKPRYPLGPGTHQALVIPNPAPTLPPSPEKPPLTPQSISHKLALTPTLGLTQAALPRDPLASFPHLCSNSGCLVISAGHRVRLVRTRQCTEPPLCLCLTPRTTPSVTQPTPTASLYWKIPTPHSTWVPLQTNTCPVTGLLTPTRHSTPPPSAREYPWAGAALPHSTPMATTPVSTPEDTPQHSPTPPTSPPPITMRTQSPLQPQSLRRPQITIPPPRPPFATQTPPSPRQQRVKAYAQQRDKVLRFLHLSPVELARHTRTLLTNLGYPDTSATPEQEELNAASSILRNLNPVGGLFDQPAAHTLALSAQPRASSVPSAFRTWDQPAAPKLCSQQPPLRVDNNNRILSYIDEPGNPADKHALRNGPQQDRPPHFDLHAPHSNAPLPRPNAPVPPQQPMGPGAPQPPFSANSSRLPPAPMPNPPTNANDFGPPNPGGPLLP
ncbi:hypothetical protein E4T56_gene12805 [Termitomyces sp. T112]|nr:hypothetical protein E4T56_gene12805 [Termitomyces sp. T112]